MPQLVQLGPLTMATDRLLAVALILAFVVVMDRLALRAGAGSARVGGFALVAGLLAARVAYVAQHWDAYARDPWSALAFWQGGFLVWPGVLAAAAIIGWRMRPRRVMLQAQAALLVLAGVWFGASTLLAPEPEPLPHLPALTRLDGTPVTPAELHGQPHVINLWATWCPPCRRELPMLEQAAHEAGTPILLVNQGESRDVVAAYLGEQGLAGDAVLLDEHAQWGSLLDAQGMPTTLFVDTQGRIVSTHIGEISRAALMDQIAAIEAGE